RPRRSRRAGVPAARRDRSPAGSSGRAGGGAAERGVVAPSLCGAPSRSLRPRTLDEAAGGGSGVLAVLEDAAAVDPDVADAGGELVRVGEGGVVAHGGRVEDDDVG